ncbi:ABC transporter ATP-binding protein [Hymenobacter koreensis]|uniref:ABC transporter ATP-binding protein n=1 Tax=Hymenobacter koreensis TaxID=1084523 RepID=A0ABP8J918_9BACT
MSVLDFDNLSKNYGRTAALRELTLSIPAGSVYGLLGPNGSGKTTTLGLALGVLRPSGGTVRWFGGPPVATTRRRIGALLETPNFYPYLSARQNLQIVADVKQADSRSIEAALETVGLAQRQREAVSGFSLGMKQRLAIGAALLGQPEVLVLDEPTNGLDPQGIADVRELVKRVAAEGRTIVMASHLLDEIEKVCTHVAVLHKGQLRASGPVSGILSTTDRIVLGLPPGTAADVLRAALSSLPFVHDVRPENEGRVSCALAVGHTPSSLNQALFAQGLTLAHLELRHRRLEDQFLSIINNS